MTRLKLTIAYDGRPWKGWQSQPCRQTVQDRLETVLAMLTGTRIVVYGSGRTDTGVHAHGQVAHITVPKSAWTPHTWLRAMNAKLPPSIRILHCEEVRMDFHARFDATAKVYEYRIWLPDVMSPFKVGFSWHPFGKLDVDLVREGASILQGTHNFSRLAANRSNMSEIQRLEAPESLIRNVRRIEVFEEDDILRLEFEGEGFLYRMVRLMVGSLVQVAKGRISIEWLRDLVETPKGEKTQHCAPADGLFLMRVLYENEVVKEKVQVDIDPEFAGV